MRHASESTNASRSAWSASSLRASGSPTSGGTSVMAALAPATAAGVASEPLILHGNPAEQIAQAAEAPDVDLLVVGSRSRAALARVLCPSVAPAGDPRADPHC